jgi:hypothetical protein
MQDISTIVLLITKILVILGLLMYLIFAGILLRQEQLMAHVLEESFEPILRLLTIIHLAGALAVLGLAVVLL